LNYLVTILKTAASTPCSLKQNQGLASWAQGDASQNHIVDVEVGLERDDFSSIRHPLYLFVWA